jgi:hypothetical protein
LVINITTGFKKKSTVSYGYASLMFITLATVLCLSIAKNNFDCAFHNIELNELRRTYPLIPNYENRREVLNHALDKALVSIGWGFLLSVVGAGFFFGSRKIAEELISVFS